jgi:hypothetical protein
MPTLEDPCKDTSGKNGIVIPHRRKRSDAYYFQEEKALEDDFRGLRYNSKR